ncbi:MAG: hypothetical protein ACYCUG_12815, partial [Acidimicrobiales bacterium]
MAVECPGGFNPRGGMARERRRHLGDLVLRLLVAPALGVFGLGALVATSPPVAASPALTWGPPTQVDGGRTFTGISCPSVSLCVAVDVNGNVVTSTNPTGGVSAWTAANVDPGNTLSGVSCPSASLCVAVDGSGNVVSSTNPTGGASAWTAANVDGTN